MTVKFYDVGQGLGALVTLPDRRQVLVDAGVAPNWPGCRQCREWSERFLDRVDPDVINNKIDLLWITHQHADHNGNAEVILKRYEVGTYVDNGQAGGSSGQKRRVTAIRTAAKERGTKIWATTPGRDNSPLRNTDEVTITPIVPGRWPADCDDHPNDCSIGLRIDYCRSSVLFTGDAEEAEEKLLQPGDINLLQVGHHGSATSSSWGFLQKTKPEYAVISAAKPSEGTNLTYCHPRSTTIDALQKHVGEDESREVLAFDGSVKCRKSQPKNWVRARASRNLYLTPRDGDVALVTTGDGRFERTH